MLYQSPVYYKYFKTTEKKPHPYFLTLYNIKITEQVRFQNCVSKGMSLFYNRDAYKYVCKRFRYLFPFMKRIAGVVNIAHGWVK
jgi:hypothetical protein